MRIFDASFLGQIPRCPATLGTWIRSIVATGSARLIIVASLKLVGTPADARQQPEFQFSDKNA